MRPRPKRATRRMSAGLVATLIARVLVLPATTALLTVAVPPEPAAAHSVAQTDMSATLTAETAARLAAKGGITVGDRIDYVIKFAPIPNGANTGPNGWVTSYIPPGLQVIGAEFVEPDGGDGWTPVQPDPPAPINDGFGSSSNSSFSGPFAGFAPGSLAQFYGDTGIFFSTDPRTAKFNKTTSGDATPVLAPIQLSNGYRVDPTGCGQLTSIVGAANCRTHNAWDAQNTHAFGSSSPSTADPQPPGNITTPYISSGRGNTPHLVGSPVAGPDTHYKLDYTGNVGPWQRVAYPGSMIGVGSAPTGTGSPTDTAWAPTSAGRTLSASNPLPSTTNAVRFAVGAIEVGTIEYALLSTVVVDDTDPNACRALDTEVFGGDAAGVDNGKDNAWRYNEPVPAVGYTCLAFDKVGPLTSSGGPITYTLRTTNTSTGTFTNLAITDLLPPGASFVSASPAPASVGGGIVTWPTVASLAPGAQLNYTITITPNSGDEQVINQGRLDTDQTEPVKAEAVTLQNAATVTLAKTATPTDVGQGDAVTYTVSVRNDGPAVASSVKVTDVLPSGFSYVAGSTSNGLGNPTIAGALHTWSIPNVAANTTYTFTFRARVGALVADGTYPNELRAEWTDGLGSRQTSASGLAAVTVTRPVTPGEVCYAVADATDTLYTIRKDGSTAAAAVGPTGVTSIEAMAVDPTGRTIYAANAGTSATFGIITPSTGTYTSLGPIGTARGVRGTLTMADPDGLAFDPFSGKLWAIERTAGEDLLYQIDPATGRVVADAFGTGSDYLVADPTNAAADDLDDLVVDPTDGTLYAIANSGVANNRLVRVNKTSGVLTVVGSFRLGAADLQDVEGMSITPAGQLFVTTGDGTTTSTDNGFYGVDKATGTTTLVRSMSPAADVEALACYTGADAGVNTISGTLFIDLDGDASLGSSETRLGNRRVELYQDLDGDGLVDPAVDRLVATSWTAADGTYRWSTSILGAYAIRVLPADAPALHTLSVPTSGSHTATFSSYGVLDANNDFGFRPPDALAVTKTSDVSGLVRPGQTVTYTVTVQNTSSTTQSGIRVDDTVPAGTTYVAGSSQVTAPTSVTSTVASDSYVTGTYASGSGWSGAWREDPGDDGSPTGGDYRITTDGSAVVQRLQKDGWVERDVDLTAYASATLTFKTRNAKYDGALGVLVNGTEVASYPGGSVDESGYTTRTVALAGAAGRVSTLRFQTTSSDGDRWYVDDVVITGTRFTGPPATTAGGDLAAGQPLASGYTLQPGGTLTATFRVVVADPISQASIDNTATARSTQQPAPTSGTVSDAVGASLGDLVWLDANGDGVRDAGEPGIGGVTVTATRRSDGQVSTTTTAGDGSYLFASLPVGTYDVVTSGAPVATRQVTNGALPRVVTLAAGDAVRTVDIGYRDLIDLRLAKTADVADPDVGQAVTFTLTLTNDGPAGATGAVVRDVLPAGVSFDGDLTDPGEGASVGDTTYDVGTRTLSWTVPTLASGADATLAFTVTNDTAAATTNLAQVWAADQLDADSTPANLAAAPAEDDEAAATLTPRSADLELTKTVDDATPRPGDQVVFTLTAANFGPATATGIVVTDTLPVGLTFVRTQNHTAGAAPTFAGGTVRWDVGALADGASASVEVVARVATDASGQPLTNTASLTATTADPGPRPDTASVVVDPVVSDLELAKSVSDPTPQRGDVVTYTLTATDAGPDDATGVVVTDVLPAGLAYVTGSGSPGVSYDGATRTVTWTAGAIAVGTPAVATYDVTVTVSTAVVNRAQVAAADQVDLDSTPGNGAGEDDEAAAAINAQDVDLSLTTSASTTSPQVGETFQLTVTLRNTGEDAATGVTVTDAVTAAGLTFVSADLTGGQGSYDPTSGVWTVGQVDAGAAPLVLVLTVRADGPGTFVSDAEVSAADQFDVDSTPANLDPTAGPAEDDEARVTVTTPTVDLRLVKSVTANAAPNPGETVEYTLVVTNDGIATATGVEVTDTLPAGLTFDAGADVTAAGQVLTWAVPGSLAAGASASTVFTVVVDGPGTYRNVAEVTAVDQYDLDSRTTFADRAVDPATADPAGFEDDEAATTITTQGADLSLAKTVVANPRPRVGETTTFRIAVTNGGPDEAQDVTVADTVEAGLTLVSASDPGFDVGTGVWTIAAIPAGSTVTVDVTAEVSADGTWGNRAEVVGVTQADPDSTPGNGATTDEDDEAEATVTTPVVDLELTQAITRNPSPNVGEELDVTLTLTNVSTTDGATGVTVLDRLPAGWTFVTAAGDGTFDDATGTWSVGAVGAGGTATLTLTVLVASVDPQTNQAQVATADQTDLDSTPGNLAAGATPAEDDESVVSATPQLVDLSVTAALVSPTTPRVGDTVVYEVTVTNAPGRDPATSVVVTDLLPPSLVHLSDTAGSTPANGISYDPATGAWVVGDLAPGATATVRISATVVASGAVVTDAEVTGVDQADVDSTPANQVGAPDEDDEARVAFTVAPAADLSLTKTIDDTTPDPGDQVTFTLTLTNDGPDQATGVSVTDVLDPAAFTFVSSTGTYLPATGVWSVGTVDVGTPRVLQIVAEVETTGTATNTAEVTAAGRYDPDSVPGDGLAGDDDQATVTLRATNADLAVTKQVAAGSTATPDVGDTVTFDVTVTNDGPDPATGVVISDPLPAGTSFSAASATDGTYDGTSGRWTLAGALAVGATETLTVTLVVDDELPFDNVASVLALDQADLDPSDDSASVAVTPTQADLSLTKSVDVARPNVGDRVVFTVTLTNQGPDDATDVTVRDVLPPGLTLLAETPSTGTYAAATGDWGIPTLAAGATATLLLDAAVGTIGPKTNRAEITAADQFDPDLTDQSATAVVTPLAVDLEVTQTVSDPTPQLGDAVTFQVVLRNRGPDTATDVVVTDLLPAGLTFVSSTDPAGYDPATGRWSVASLAAGSTATLEIVATVDTFGTKENVVEVTSATQADVDSTPGNGVADPDDLARVTVAPQQVDLELTTTLDAGPHTYGGPAAFTVTVTNQGPDAATGVTVTGPLPAGLTLDGATPSTGTYVGGVWTVGSLAAGQTVTLTLDATIGATGTTTYEAQVATQDQADLDSTPGTGDTTEDDHDAVDLVVAATADLALTKTVSDAAPDVGDTVTFTVTLTNAGPDTATGIEVADAAPAGMTFTAVDAGAGASYAGGVWSVPSLASGATATLTVQATVDVPSPSPNVAEVTAVDQVDPDSDPGNGAPGEDDRATSSVAGTAIDLSVTNTFDPTSPTTAPDVGDTVVYRVTVTNAGPSVATGVSVRDLLPAELAYVTSSGPGAYDPATGLWTLAGSLPAGGTATLTITATVVGSGTVTAIAEVASADQPDLDSTPANGVGTEDDLQAISVTVAPAADLSLTKTASAATPNLGGDVTFTLTLRNAGPDTATGVVVTDLLPAGLTFKSATPALAYDAGTGAWTVPPVAAGASATLTIVATVATTAPVSNVAEVTTAPQHDPDSTPANGPQTPAEDDRSAVTLTPQLVDLSLTTSLVTAGPNAYGDRITFEVVVANEPGSSTATNVAVTDLLPAGSRPRERHPADGDLRRGDRHVDHPVARRRRHHPAHRDRRRGGDRHADLRGRDHRGGPGRHRLDARQRSPDAGRGRPRHRGRGRAGRHRPVAHQDRRRPDPRRGRHGPVHGPAHQRRPGRGHGRRGHRPRRAGRRHDRDRLVDDRRRVRRDDGRVVARHGRDRHRDPHRRRAPRRPRHLLERRGGHRGRPDRPRLGPRRRRPGAGRPRHGVGHHPRHRPRGHPDGLHDHAGARGRRRVRRAGDQRPGGARHRDGGRRHRPAAGRRDLPRPHDDRRDLRARDGGVDGRDARPGELPDAPHHRHGGRHDPGHEPRRGDRGRPGRHRLDAGQPRHPPGRGRQRDDDGRRARHRRPVGHEDADDPDHAAHHGRRHGPLRPHGHQRWPRRRDRGGRRGPAAGRPHLRRRRRHDDRRRGRGDLAGRRPRRRRQRDPRPDGARHRCGRHAQHRRGDGGRPGRRRLDPGRRARRRRRHRQRRRRGHRGRPRHHEDGHPRGPTGGRRRRELRRRGHQRRPGHRHRGRGDRRPAGRPDPGRDAHDHPGNLRPEHGRVEPRGARRDGDGHAHDHRRGHGPRAGHQRGAAVGQRHLRPGRHQRHGERHHRRGGRRRGAVDGGLPDRVRRVARRPRDVHPHGHQPGEPGPPGRGGGRGRDRPPPRRLHGHRGGRVRHDHLERRRHLDRRHARPGRQRDPRDHRHGGRPGRDHERGRGHGRHPRRPRLDAGERRPRGGRPGVGDRVRAGDHRPEPHQRDDRHHRRPR